MARYSNGIYFRIGDIKNNISNKSIFNMKIGDKVICIKELQLENKSRFIPERYYFIRDIEVYKQKTLVQVEDIWFVIQEVSDLHFHTYFASIAEYREKRMTEIIED